MLKPTILALCLLIALLSQPSSARVDDLKTIGSGQLSWLFFDVYQASLYSPDGRYQEQRYPLALKIQYQRDIKAADLIKTTEQEWQRLGITYQAEWLSQLAALWPDIKTGDQLTFRAESANNGRFYFNEQILGQLQADNFAQAFLAIWLAPQTFDPELREKLIGENHAQTTADPDSAESVTATEQL